MADPPDYTASLYSIAGYLASVPSIRAVLQNNLYDIRLEISRTADHLGDLAQTVAVWGVGALKAIDNTLFLAAQAVTQSLVPAVQELPAELGNIRLVLDAEIRPAIQSGASSLRGIRETGQGIMQVLQAVTGLDPATWLGDAPDIDPAATPTFANAMAQSQLSAHKAMWKHESPSWGEGLIGDVGHGLWSILTSATDGKGLVEGLAAYGGNADNIWKALMAQLRAAVGEYLSGWMADPATLGDEAVEAVWGRAGKLYATAVGLGVAAHGVSMLLSTRVAGSLGLNMTGIAALIGKFAGFDPIVEAIQGEYYNAYLKVPMRYYMNNLLRPNIPGAMDLMRMRGKRIISDRSEFDKLMSYWGFSPEWLDRWENDLYTEPRHFELTIMGENDEIPDEWWIQKCQRMQYTSQDAGYMAGGIKRKVARTFLNAYMSQVQRSFAAGYLSWEDLEQEVKDTGINELGQDYAMRTAESRRRHDEITQHVRLATDQYSRDEIDDEDLACELDTVVVDPKVVDRLVAMARIRRFRRVYFKTPVENARAAVGTLRRGYVAGLVTGSEYFSAMVLSGMEPQVADLRLELDSDARDRAVLKRFRRFGLPRLRDELLHGEKTILEYERELRRGGFPPEHIGDELALARALVDRRIQGTVRSGQLPSYKRAYVVGLVSARTLRRVMEQAGLTPAEIHAQSLVLEYARRRAIRSATTRDQEMAAELARQAAGVAAG